MSDWSKSSSSAFWRSRDAITLVLFLGVIAFLLLYEHRAHVLGGYWLVASLVIVCVVSYWLMHGGRGGSDRRDDSRKDAGV